MRLPCPIQNIFCLFEKLKSYKFLNENLTDEGLRRNIHLIDNYFFDEKGKVNWYEISKLIPQNLEKNIKNKYDMLNENEIKLCCLFLFEVDLKNMSNILPFRPNSVYVMKNKIKQKKRACQN